VTKVWEMHCTWKEFDALVAGGTAFSNDWLLTEIAKNIFGEKLMWQALAARRNGTRVCLAPHPEETLSRLPSRLTEKVEDI